MINNLLQPNRPNCTKAQNLKSDMSRNGFILKVRGNLLVLLLFVSFIGVFSSCDNEEDIPVSDELMVQSFSSDSINYLNITYMGNTYENVPTTYDEEGNFIFLDNDFSKVYATELANDNDWSISILDSCNVTFYGSLAENLKSNDIYINDNVKPIEAKTSFVYTRSSYENLAQVTLYDDKNFKDRHFDFVLSDSIIYTEVANLKKSPWKFNDKCSSLILTNNLPNNPNKTIKLGYYNYVCSKIEVVFIGYDDKNFSDRTITCVCPPAGVKKYPSLPGFNDKMSSFKLFFAQAGQHESTL